jgi:lipid-A-disaccharide synthase
VTQPRAPSIVILAGEASGDEHAAGVARALRALWPTCHLVGTGGARLAAEGVELVARLDDLAVMGFVEVAARLPFFARLERQVGAILEQGVDLVIPVDYPGFNLRVTEKAHDLGIPVLYYIAPQVWAWKPGRAARLARSAERIAVILPFEEEIFRKEGGQAVFVGHPLLDRQGDIPSREDFCKQSGLDPEREILALLPGSRAQEVRRHLTPFLEAGQSLSRTRPGLQIAVARADTVRVDLPKGASAVIVDDARSLLHHSRAAIVKSGTSTLEAALAGVPFVVAYKAHPWTYFLARRLVRVPHIALANLVVGDRVVPEVLQRAVTGEGLARALAPLVEDTPERARVVAGLALVREKLGRPGAAGRVADLAAEILARRGLERDRA